MRLQEIRKKLIQMMCWTHVFLITGGSKLNEDERMIHLDARVARGSQYGMQALIKDKLSTLRNIIDSQQ